MYFIRAYVIEYTEPLGSILCTSSETKSENDNDLQNRSNPILTAYIETFDLNNDSKEFSSIYMYVYYNIK